MTDKQKEIYKFLKQKPGYLKKSARTIPCRGSLKDKEIALEEARRDIGTGILSKLERKSIYNQLLKHLKVKNDFMCILCDEFKEFKEHKIQECFINLHLPELWKFRPVNTLGKKVSRFDAWYDNLENDGTKELRIKHVKDALKLLNK